VYTVSDQIRLIYHYYAAGIELRRIGSAGPLNLLMNLENCKEMLQDFQLLPQLVDVSTFLRLFRSVKLWEWEIADFLCKSSIKRSASNDDQSVVSSYSTLNGTTAMSVKQEVDPSDPYDFKGSIGHFSLNIWYLCLSLFRVS
jgi:hypothetical protein